MPRSAHKSSGRQYRPWWKHWNKVFEPGTEVRIDGGGISYFVKGRAQLDPSKSMVLVPLKGRGLVGAIRLSIVKAPREAVPPQTPEKSMSRKDRVIAAAEIEGCLVGAPSRQILDLFKRTGCLTMNLGNEIEGTDRKWSAGKLPTAKVPSKLDRSQWWVVAVHTSTGAVIAADLAEVQPCSSMQEAMVARCANVALNLEAAYGNLRLTG
jgi:hypothetical protein